MRRLHAAATALPLLLLACAGVLSPVAANVPMSASIGKVLRLVGASSGVLSTSVGDYTVTIRDGANNPIQV